MYLVTLDHGLKPLRPNQSYYLHVVFRTSASLSLSLARFHFISQAQLTCLHSFMCAHVLSKIADALSRDAFSLRISGIRASTQLPSTSVG